MARPANVCQSPLWRTQHARQANQFHSDLSDRYYDPVILKEARVERMQPADRGAQASEVFDGPASAHVPVHLISAAARLTVDHVEEALQGSGVSVAQWVVMLHLYEGRGWTMTELGAASGLTGATLTRLVDRLTTSALAHRNVDPTDRRRVLVHLSHRGRTLVRKLQPAVRRGEIDAVSHLEEDDRATLRHLLVRMLGPT